MHGKEYEVPSVTMRMETEVSDQDFEEPLPSQVEADLLSMPIARHANEGVAQKKGKDWADKVPDRDTRSKADTS